jgi:signal peptidase I
MRLPTAVDGSELRFWLGLIGLFVALSVVHLWLWVVVPAAVARGHSVVVTSGSMGPVIKAGDVLVLKPHDGSLLAPGAVVTFRDPAGRGLLTHRIVQVNEDGSYRTRGDANHALDSGVLRPERIVGNARLLIPLIGMPTVWLADGNLVGVGAWLGGILLAAWMARFALLRRYSPWNADRAVPPATGVHRGAWPSRPLATDRGWSIALWEVQPAGRGMGPAQGRPRAVRGNPSRRRPPAVSAASAVGAPR